MDARSDRPPGFFDRPPRFGFHAVLAAAFLEYLNGESTPGGARLLAFPMWWFLVPLVGFWLGWALVYRTRAQRGLAVGRARWFVVAPVLDRHHGRSRAD